MKATLQPSILRWVRTRAGLSVSDFAEKMKVTEEEVETWERSGEIDEEAVPLLADKARIPFGYLFLEEPPKEALGISDFRRVAKEPIGQASPELLDVLNRCMRRQDWYREYLIANGAEQLKFVGSRTPRSDINETAREISKIAQLGPDYTREFDDWESRLSRNIESIEDAGVIVSKVGFADGNTHRKLSVAEFRGFALSDLYAPLVFVNGADAPAAQMFTLAHELVHIWLGESAVSNLDRTYSAEKNPVERFCNAVAAEVLLPLDKLKARWNENKSDGSEIARIAKMFGVSEIVVARRGKDAKIVTSDYYNQFYTSQVAAQKAAGGNYYLSKPYEASRRFSAAVIRDARNGKTMFREAMELLGIKSFATFERYAASLQISA